jgi:NDP-mannose synthase
VIPKPLVPIGDRYSILEIVMLQLAQCGFKRATLAIGHLGHLIRAYVGDGSQWGLEVDYAEERSPLGTVGPALMVLDTSARSLLAHERRHLDRHELRRPADGSTSTPARR